MIYIFIYIYIATYLCAISPYMAPIGTYVSRTAMHSVYGGRSAQVHSCPKIAVASWALQDANGIGMPIADANN